MDGPNKKVCVWQREFESCLHICSKASHRLTLFLIFKNAYLPFVHEKVAFNSCLSVLKSPDRLLKFIKLFKGDYYYYFSFLQLRRETVVKDAFWICTKYVLPGRCLQVDFFGRGSKTPTSSLSCPWGVQQWKTKKRHIWSCKREAFALNELRNCKRRRLIPLCSLSHGRLSGGHPEDLSRAPQDKVVAFLLSGQQREMLACLLLPPSTAVVCHLINSMFEIKPQFKMYWY